MLASSLQIDNRTVYERKDAIEASPDRGAQMSARYASGGLRRPRRRKRGMGAMRRYVAMDTP